MFCHSCFQAHRIAGALIFATTLMLGAMLTTPARAQANLANAAIEIYHVRGNIYMLVGPGGNITVQAGDDGVLLVDTKFAPLAGKVFSAIREISDGPLTYIINTHAHPDHIGGNAELAALGSNNAGGDVLSAREDAGAQAKVVSHENVLLDILAMPEDERIPVSGWPVDAYITDYKDMFFNGEAIRIFHEPNAHTNADSIVFFRRSDVISTGDVFNTTSYPVIDTTTGGTLQGIIDALYHIVYLTVPEVRQEGGTLVIPGHGRLGDESDVVDYRDMLIIIRDRIQYLVDQGASLEEVLASQPTYEYDGLYGADEGFWTTQMFIETVYNELSGN